MIFNTPWLLFMVFIISGFFSKSQVTLVHDAAYDSLYINEVYHAPEKKKFWWPREDKVSWIEIRNRSTRWVYSHQLYLTNDLKDPLRWKVTSPSVKKLRNGRKSYLVVSVNRKLRKAARIMTLGSANADLSTLYLLVRNSTGFAVTDTFYSKPVAPRNSMSRISGKQDSLLYSETNTPGYGNLLLSNSVPSKHISISALGGISWFGLDKDVLESIYGQGTVVNLSPLPSWGFELLRTKQKWKFFELQSGFQLYHLGYNVSSERKDTTTKVYRRISVTGETRYLNLNWTHRIHLKISSRWTVFVGISLIIPIEYKYLQTQKIHYTFIATGLEEEKTTYYSSINNESYLAISLAMQYGIRYHIAPHWSLTLEYYNQSYYDPQVDGNTSRLQSIQAALSFNMLGHRRRVAKSSLFE